MPEYINRYELREQFDAVRLLSPKAGFFRSKFFPEANDEFLTNEKAEWDEVTQGAPMARYVNPRIGAEPSEREPFKTREITTPWIQESRIVTADQLAKRQAGENPYSLTTSAERARNFIAEDIAHCTDAIDNRIEEQCAAMMLSGRVEIKDTKHGINELVDYNLPNILTLTGGDRWDQVGVQPLHTLQDMFETLLAVGYIANELYIADDVYRALMENEDFKKLLDIRRIEMGLIKPDAVKSYGTAQYKGTLADPLVDIYTYGAVYRDPNTGIVQPYIPSGTVLMTSNESVNRIMFGAVTIIEEETRNWATIEGRYIMERFIERKPPTEITQITSRPLPTPVKVDSWYVAHVL